MVASCKSKPTYPSVLTGDSQGWGWGGTDPAGALEAAAGRGLQQIAHDMGDLGLDWLVVALRYAAHVKHGQPTGVPQRVWRRHAIPGLQHKRTL
jgi:hypothetical protein